MRGDTPFAGDAIEAVLARAFGPIGLDANDGIVPLRSQLWSNIIWAGYGDHLDVLGHYLEKRDDTTPPELRHRDWLTSGSDFTDREQAVLMDAIASGMLTSRDNRPDPNS
jgi:triacylglycerol lipase